MSICIWGKRIHVLVNVFLPIVLACPVTAQTVRKTIDFEDRNAGDIIFDQYPGIVFVGGDSADRPCRLIAPTLGTVSGIKALQWLDTIAVVPL